MSIRITISSVERIRIIAPMEDKTNIIYKVYEAGCFVTQCGPYVIPGSYSVDVTKVEILAEKDGYIKKTTSLKKALE